MQICSERQEDNSKLHVVFLSDVPNSSSLQAIQTFEGEFDEMIIVGNAKKIILAFFYVLSDFAVKI